MSRGCGEVISATAAIDRGGVRAAATQLAIVSGRRLASAPEPNGSEVHLRQRRDRELGKGDQAEESDAVVSSVVATGRATKGADRFMGY